jgi:hypothetical protein
MEKEAIGMVNEKRSRAFNIMGRLVSVTFMSTINGNAMHVYSTTQRTSSVSHVLSDHYSENKRKDMVTSDIQGKAKELTSEGVTLTFGQWD